MYFIENPEFCSIMFLVLLHVRSIHIWGIHEKIWNQKGDDESDAAADALRSVAVVADAVAHGEAVEKDH